MNASECLDRVARRPAVSASPSLASSFPSQLVFRELNEDIALRSEAPAESEEHYIRVVCECQRRSCGKRLRLPFAHYESIRRFPTRFVMTHEHWAARGERVVEEHPGFVVVEKTGPEARVAIRLDPRRRWQSGTQAA